MSRKLSLTLTQLFVLTTIFYLAYASKQLSISLADYMNNYLNVAQKYLYLITIFTCPFLLFLQKPIMESNVKIRLKENMFYYILKSGIIIVLFISAFIYFSFLLSGIVLKLESEFDLSFVNLFIKLFLFVFGCYILSYSVYFWFNRLICGVLSVLSLNFILLMILYSIDFFIMNNTMPDQMMSIILSVYVFIEIFGGLMLLYKGVNTKECLK